MCDFTNDIHIKSHKCTSRTIGKNKAIPFPWGLGLIQSHRLSLNKYRNSCNILRSKNIQINLRSSLNRKCTYLLRLHEYMYNVHIVNDNFKTYIFCFSNSKKYNNFKPYCKIHVFWNLTDFFRGLSEKTIFKKTYLCLYTLFVTK